MKLPIVRVLIAGAATLALSGSGVAAAPSAKEGGALFQSQHCVMCHGMDGKGYPAIHTPDFTSPKWQAAYSDQQITEVITNGKKGTPMPAFGSKLTASQIQDLVAYIRSLKSAEQN